MLLKARIAVLTGGGGGIGRGVAWRYAKEGAKLALVGIQQEYLDETARTLDESGTGYGAWRLAQGFVVAAAAATGAASFPGKTT